MSNTSVMLTGYVGKLSSCSKEWKSHANLHLFDTSNPNIAEGLI